MRRALLRRALAPLVTLALLATVALPAPPALATYGPRSPAHSAVQRTHHIRVAGSLMDASPATDSRLDVYTKSRQLHRYVYMTAATVVKMHQQRVHRAVLHKSQYVIATCQRRGDGALEALTVSIVIRKHKKK